MSSEKLDALMRRWAKYGFLAGLVFGPLVGAGGVESTCTPNIYDFEEPLAVQGVFNLEFRLLVVGCSEDLRDIWLLEKERVERAFEDELSTSHQLEIGALMSKRDRELLRRLKKVLNKEIGMTAVHDLYFYDVEAWHG